MSLKDVFQRTLLATAMIAALGVSGLAEAQTKADSETI